MNRLRCWIAGGLILLCPPLALAAESPQGAIGKDGKQCGGCHAIPPGTGPEDGRFKPGSHAEHAKFGCDRCHPVGINTMTAAHIDGRISLNPELEYQHGNDVPWPGMGSGSCGGKGYPYPPTGCHVRMPDATCFWVPGKQCQPRSNP